LDSRKLLAQIAENWPAKVLSIALALILFIFHHMNTLEERFFSVPLLVETQGNVIPASAYTRMIRISVRGDAARVRSLLEEDIVPYIDLRGKEKGIYRVPVQVRTNGTAQGLEPLEIKVDPLEISIVLDHKVSKYVPLTGTTRGGPQKGYELVSFTLTPSQVVLEGPADEMSGISELFTDFIDLDGRSEDFSIMVNIVNREPLVVIQGNGMTEFHGVIREIIGLETFTNLPIRVDRLSERFNAELEVRIGSIRLEGSQHALEQYQASASFLYVDASSITEPGTYTLPVVVPSIPNLTLSRKDPERVRIQVTRKPGTP
jgi:YbbR domain-containing protein